MTETNDKLANSSMLMVIARFSMIAATLALPIAGWMLQRGVNAVDEVARKVDTIRDQTIETNGNVKLIQQTQQVQSSILTDHEGRMRLLERVRPSTPQ